MRAIFNSNDYKIVQFRNGKYGIRKGILFFYEYYDFRDNYASNPWWCSSKSVSVQTHNLESLYDHYNKLISPPRSAPKRPGTGKDVTKDFEVALANWKISGKKHDLDNQTF